MPANLTGDEVRSIGAAQVDSYGRQQGSSQTPISIHSSPEEKGNEDYDCQDTTTGQEGGDNTSEDAECITDSDSSSEEGDGSEAGSTYEPNRPAKRGKNGKGKKRRRRQRLVDAREELIKRHCGACERWTLDGAQCLPAEATSFGERCQSCGDRNKADCHHAKWLKKFRVKQWDDLVRKGHSHEEADCMVCGKLNVFAHRARDLVKPSAYLQVDANIRAEFCGPDFAGPASSTSQLAPADDHHAPIAARTASNVNISEDGNSHGISNRHISPIPEHHPRKRNADEAGLTPASDSHPSHNTPVMVPGTPMPSEASVRQAWADIEPPADTAALKTSITRGYVFRALWYARSLHHPFARGEEGGEEDGGLGRVLGLGGQRAQLSCQLHRHLWRVIRDHAPVASVSVRYACT
ncbi:uncharacterized protein PSANT_02661 [Moesziomyces antarcticus]|uniref:Uncharacterized protein n=1 Tax=Pseudozyma antarctica TaxID=84753 RepID=A0A5C3FMH0_PSEA2|nr:uncharacterized protein PSANT_02661 [Moesziomyces antarcticus]